MVQYLHSCVIVFALLVLIFISVASTSRKVTMYWLRLSRPASMYMMSSGLVGRGLGETAGTRNLIPQPTSTEDTMYSG